MGCKEGCTKFVTVGRLSPEKNPTFLLEGFKNAVLKRGTNAVLVIVGDGNMLGYLKEISVTMGIDDRVVWVGAVDRKDVNGILDQMDVFVNPNLNPDEVRERLGREGGAK